MLDTSPSTIRFWERRGLITPSRSQGRYRVFTLEDVQRLKRVKHLKKSQQLDSVRDVIAKEFADQSAHTSVPPIGPRLRKLRMEKELTLEDVAARTGLSVGFVSSVERSKASASIATLQKLAKFYDTNVLSFFGQDATGSKVVPAKGRRILETQPGIRIELLALGHRAMEPHLFRIAPGAESGGAYEHEGEEFIYVIRGKFEIWLDEVERYNLTAGDSIYFPSSQTHRWSNPGSTETTLIWINTPPTF